MYTEEISKIGLSNVDVKILQIFDKITSYLYDSNFVKYATAAKIFKYKILITLQMKIKQNLIQNSHIFQIIHTEY